MKKWLHPFFIVVIASILLVVSVAIWFFQTHEYVSTVIYTGYKGEARYNNLLAFQRFLINQGINVAIVNSGNTLKNHVQKNDIVLIHPDSYPLLNADVEFLLQWVKAGGYLVLMARESEDEAKSYKPLLAAVQTQLVKNKPKDNQEVFQAATLTLKDTSYSVVMDIRFRLETTQTPLLQLESPYGNYALLHQHGNGYIAVVTTLTGMKNMRVGQGDHAAFFWQLLNFPRAVTSLYFFEILESAPSLWDALLEHAWMILISGGACLLLWLWIASRRFGSCFPEPSLARRRLLEHIEASAYYLWRHRQSNILLQQTRQAVLQRIEQIHPDWLHRDTTQLHAKLAKIAVVSPADITLALQTDTLDSTADFTLAIQTLSKIRKAL